MPTGTKQTNTAVAGSNTRLYRSRARDTERGREREREKKETANRQCVAVESVDTGRLEPMNDLGAGAEFWMIVNIYKTYTTRVLHIEMQLNRMKEINGEERRAQTKQQNKRLDRKYETRTQWLGKQWRCKNPAWQHTKTKSDCKRKSSERWKCGRRRCKQCYKIFVAVFHLTRRRQPTRRRQTMYANISFDWI